MVVLINGKKKSGHYIWRLQGLLRITGELGVNLLFLCVRMSILLHGGHHIEKGCSELFGNWMSIFLFRVSECPSSYMGGGASHRKRIFRIIGELDVNFSLLCVRMSILLHGGHRMNSCLENTDIDMCINPQDQG